MIEDARLSFTNGTTNLNTGAAGTYQIGDAIDLSVTGRDIGAGSGPLGNLLLVVIVKTTATSGGAATVQFALGTSDAQTGGTLTSPTVVTASAAIPFAQLVAGTYAYIVSIPPAVYKRYIALLQIEGAAALTAGAIEAFLVDDVSLLRYYPQGFVG